MLYAPSRAEYVKGMTGEMPVIFCVKIQWKGPGYWIIRWRLIRVDDIIIRKGRWSDWKIIILTYHMTCQVPWQKTDSEMRCYGDWKKCLNYIRQIVIL